MIKRLEAALLLCFSLLPLMSCAPWESGSSTIEVVIISPAHGSFVNTGAEVRIIFRNENNSKIAALYNIVIATDGDLTNVVAETFDVGEDSDGGVNWVPNYSFTSNQTYYWRYTANFSTDKGPGTSVSGTYSFSMSDANALAAGWPQNSGYMDVNRVSNPFFATGKYFQGTGVDVTYEFELYRDAAGTELLGYQTGIISQDSDPYLFWYPTVTDISEDTGETTTQRGIYNLADGQIPPMDTALTHYWRVRAVVNGVPIAWSSMYNFYFQNLCDLNGSTYAQSVIEWSVSDECKSLLTHTNTNDALGGPNAGGHSNNIYTGYGYLSIGYGGYIIAEMGKTIYNWPGHDIQVWEYISFEWIEMYAGESPVGPWHYLGKRFCEDWCGWDLDYAGLQYARFIKVMDASPSSWQCHATAGADVDSIQATGWADNGGLCQ